MGYQDEWVGLNLFNNVPVMFYRNQSSVCDADARGVTKLNKKPRKCRPRNVWEPDLCRYTINSVNPNLFFVEAIGKHNDLRVVTGAMEIPTLPESPEDKAQQIELLVCKLRDRCQDAEIKERMLDTYLGMSKKERARHRGSMEVHVRWSDLQTVLDHYGVPG
jgi:hypothetical protein